MSTSFYGSLPESTTTTSDNTKSVPIPITSSTVTRTYVEYTSSPEIGSIETQTKKYTKYLDEADLDFEKTFQQQSAIVSTVTSNTTQSSTSTIVTSLDAKDSTSTVTTTTTVISSSSEKKDDEKLWDKPLGNNGNLQFVMNSI